MGEAVWPQFGSVAGGFFEWMHEGILDVAGSALMPSSPRKADGSVNQIIYDIQGPPSAQPISPLPPQLLFDQVPQCGLPCEIGAQLLTLPNGTVTVGPATVVP